MSKLMPAVVVQNDTQGNKTERYEVRTVAQFAALLRKANYARLHCHIDGRVTGDDLSYWPDYFSGAMTITKAAALAFARDVLASPNPKDCYIRVSLCYYAPSYASRKSVALWIG
jgi:hypothetical protein